MTPDEHIAYFLSASRETAHNERLIMRQFNESLQGVAFTWINNLENGSIKTWDELVDAFRAKFAVVVSRVTLADLISAMPKKGEKMVEFLHRWRALAIRCERELSEKESVDIMIQDIGSSLTGEWMAPFLKMRSIFTYHDLVNKVDYLERHPPQNALDLSPTMMAVVAEIAVAETQKVTQRQSLL